MARRTKDVRSLMLSNFYCTRCGCKSIPVFRQAGKEREPGHLKKMFCLNCQTETNMAEIRPYGLYNLEDFWIEYEYHNFDHNGNRIEPWKQFVAKIKQQEDIR